MQPEHAGVQFIDSPHNLGLLTCEGLRGIGPAHLAPIRRDGITFAVGVGTASLLIFTEAGEVVEHIKGGEGNIPVQFPGRARAGVLKSDDLGGAIRPIFQGHRETRLQFPGIITEVHNEPALESGGGPHSHRHALGGGIIGKEVGHRHIRLGIAPEVGPRAPIIQYQHIRRVIGIQCLHLLRILARVETFAGLPQRLGAAGQAHFAVLVGGIVIGHRERPGYPHEHALHRFALRGRGIAGNLDRLRSGRFFLQRRDSSGINFGQSVKFGNRAAHFHIGTGLQLGSRRSVDENTVGGIGMFHPGCLDIGPVEPAFRVGRGYDAARGHFLPGERTCLPISLDLRDGHGHGRIACGSRAGVRCWIGAGTGARLGLRLGAGIRVARSCAVVRPSRRSRNNTKIGRIIIRIRTVGNARSGVRGHLGIGAHAGCLAFRHACVSVSNQVNSGGGIGQSRVNTGRRRQHHNPALGPKVERGSDTLRELRTVGAIRSGTYHQISPGLQAAAQGHFGRNVLPVAR